MKLFDFLYTRSAGKEKAAPPLRKGPLRYFQIIRSRILEPDPA